MILQQVLIAGPKYHLHFPELSRLHRRGSGDGRSCPSALQWQVGNKHVRVIAKVAGGIATAPAIVTGYLMWKYNWNFDTALTYIQSKRYCVSPMSVRLRGMKAGRALR